MKCFLNYFGLRMILLKVLQNVTFSLNILSCTLQYSLGRMHFYTTEKIKFPFTKYFSSAIVNQIVNKCLNG